ncbi:MAG: Ig-like domain-containing protein [Blastocatellia bacterium]|nr:Ig-like domain-containing protein [Blastocatellia bacterium]
MKKKNGTDGKDGTDGVGILLRSVCSACFVIFCFFAFPNRVLGQTQTIRWVADPANAQKITIEVVGVNAEALHRLRRGRWQPAQWRQWFAVYADEADTAMAGEYRVREDVLQFEPRFPFDPGLSYRAEFHLARLPGGRANAKPTVSRFRLPPRDLTPTTMVAAVYPSADVVPENLLKFYLHFSAPMQRGEIYEHIQLRDSTGRVVELPFLEIDEELWDATLTRLTLFIDPGRIKRGVLPLEEIGPSLQAGKSYTLVIRREWKDGNGAPLKAEFQKSFRVVAPDREPLDPAKWALQAPPAGSRAPVVLTFPEPLDHALAQRLITIVDADGQAVAGETALDDQEKRWQFTPRAAWRSGGYGLVVRTTIEDLAGNNIGKPFEVDLFAGVERRLTTSSIKLPFEIR